MTRNTWTEPERAISHTPTGTLHRLGDGRLVHRLAGDDEEPAAARGATP